MKLTVVKEFRRADSNPLEQKVSWDINSNHQKPVHGCWRSMDFSYLVSVYKIKS